MLLSNNDELKNCQLQKYRLCNFSMSTTAGRTSSCSSTHGLPMRLSAKPMSNKNIQEPQLFCGRVWKSEALLPWNEFWNLGNLGHELFVAPILLQSAHTVFLDVLPWPPLPRLVPNHRNTKWDFKLRQLCLFVSSLYFTSSLVTKNQLQPCQHWLIFHLSRLRVSARTALFQKISCKATRSQTEDVVVDCHRISCPLFRRNSVRLSENWMFFFSPSFFRIDHDFPELHMILWKS